MTRIVILGGPKTGKTTLAEHFSLGGTWTPEHGTGPGRARGPGAKAVRHTDDLISLGWSEASQAASAWFDEPGPWIIEGVAAVRALRKWRDQHPGERPPVDRVIYLTRPFVDLTPGQRSMAKGVDTVWEEIVDWLRHHGISIESAAEMSHRVAHPRTVAV